MVRLLLQKHKLVKKAIPNIVKAIKTVVSLSKNEDFKGKCFNLVKVSFKTDELILFQLSLKTFSSSVVFTVSGYLGER